MKTIIYSCLAFLVIKSAHAQSNVVLGPGAGAALPPTAEWNVAIGYQALNSNIGAQEKNIAIGGNAMVFLTNAGKNIAMGYSALANLSSGTNNIAIGMDSAVMMTSGENNSMVGSGTGRQNQGSSNSFFGTIAGFNNILGNGNVFVGGASGNSNENGSYNSYFGTEAGAWANGAKSYNTFLGYQAGHYSSASSSLLLGVGAGAHSGGQDNIFVGRSTGDNHAGDNNILIGTETAINNTGSGNVIVGYHLGDNLTAGSNNVFLGRVILPNVASTNTSAGNNTSNTIIFADSQANQRLYLDNNGYAGIGLGDNVRPKNRLDIGAGLPNTAGLRFRGLNSNSTPVANPSTNVLSVNANGDVILVPDGGSGSGSGGGVTSITTTGNSINLTPSGTPVNSYAITANTLYTADGALTGDRTVNLSGRRLFFNTTNAGTPSLPGQIYIGTSVSTPTSTGNYRLYVEGGILTEKVKVATRTTANWADYVFDDNYNLPSLKEVEAYIEKENHLPNIPSADEIACEGLDLADMQAKQMAKIEELTLYAIEQDKKLEKQAGEIELLKAQVLMLLNERKP